MKYKDWVLACYPSALCVQNAGLYSVVKPNGKGDGTLAQSLSSPHITEELAWHFAAIRVRLEERAKSRMENNRAAVLKIYPKAYCADVSGDYYQIRRPRLVDDKPATLTYMTLSGRFSNAVLAWQNAAERLAVRDTERKQPRLKAG